MTSNISSFVDFFPNELSLGIFSFLSITSLFQCNQVNKKWHILTNDDNLWKIVAKGRLSLPTDPKITKGYKKYVVEKYTIHTLSQLSNALESFFERLSVNQSKIFTCIFSNPVHTIQCEVSIFDKNQQEKEEVSPTRETYYYIGPLLPSFEKTVPESFMKRLIETVGETQAQKYQQDLLDQNISLNSDIHCTSGEIMKSRVTINAPGCIIAPHISRSIECFIMRKQLTLENPNRQTNRQMKQKKNSCVVS